MLLILDCKGFLQPLLTKMGLSLLNLIYNLFNLISKFNLVHYV